MPSNTIYLDVLFIILASLKTCDLLQPNDKIENKFNKLKESLVLDGEVLTQISVRSSVECGLQCIEFIGCDGINYEPKTKTGKFKTSCELIRKSDESVYKRGTMDRQGWESYIITQDIRPEAGDDKTTIANENSIEFKTTPVATSSFQSDMPFITTEGQSQESTESFEDTNPVFCDIQAAFVYQNQIYLISGEVIYTFSDVTQLSAGPDNVLRLVDVFPGISQPLTAIYSNEEETQTYVINDDTVQTYLQPSIWLQWSLVKTESQTDFWGTSYSGVTSVHSPGGNVIILLGDQVTQLGQRATCKYATSCSGNVLMSTNRKDGPDQVTASCSLSTNKAIIFNDNLFYSFTRDESETKGTWAKLGKVKCH